MNLGQQRRFGSIIGYVYTICQSIISIIYIPLLLRGIGDSEYGLYQILSSVIAYFAAMEAPLSASLLRYYSLYKENGDKIKMENTLAIGKRIFALFSIIILVVSIPIALVFRYVYSASLNSGQIKEAMLMFVIMIGNLLINLNGYTYIAAITANESFIFLKLSSLITIIIQPFLVIFVIKKMPYAFIIVLIATILSLILFYVRKYYAKYKLMVAIKYHKSDKELVKGIVKLSAAVLLVAIADQIFWKTDQLILGAMYDTRTVSVYSIGAQINSMFISIACVIGGMTLPMVTKVSKQQSTNIKFSQIFAKIGRYQSYLIYLVLTGVILYGKEFILILSGPNYLDTYYVALLLMIPYSVDLIQICAGSILQVKDKYYLRSIILFIIAIINIVLTINMTRKYGMTGAAIATTISILISDIILNIVYSKVIKLDVNMFWKQVIPIIIAAILTSGIGYLITYIDFDNIYISFGVHIVLYSLVYILIMFSFIMNKNEKELVKSLVRKICI